MIKVKIVADSINRQNDRLTSIVLTYPRIIHSEMMTHRMFSRNASSSRAVPVDKMIKAVRENTFCPFEFQKAHKGMQGSEYFTDKDKQECIDLWLESAELALQQAEKMKAKGISKQIINRILEPYQYYTMLITGSKEGWDNFFSLRNPVYGDSAYGLDKCSITFKSKKEYCKYFNISEDYQTDLQWYGHNYGQAEIHMMTLSEKIYDAMNESTPEKLEPGDWHIPFSDTFDMGHFADTQNGIDWLKMVKVSTARAARISYTVIEDEKEIDYERMIELHDKLIELKHLSPLEHCARAMTEDEYHQNIKGHVDTVQKTVNWKDYFPSKESLGWCRNFKGFISYRHIIETQK